MKSISPVSWLVLTGVREKTQGPLESKAFTDRPETVATMIHRIRRFRRKFDHDRPWDIYRPVNLFLSVGASFKRTGLSSIRPS